MEIQKCSSFTDHYLPITQKSNTLSRSYYSSLHKQHWSTNTDRGENKYPHGAYSTEGEESDLMDYLSAWEHALQFCVRYGKPALSWQSMKWPPAPWLNEINMWTWKGWQMIVGHNLSFLVSPVILKVFLPVFSTPPPIKKYVNNANLSWMTNSYLLPQNVFLVGIQYWKLMIQ